MLRSHPNIHVIRPCDGNETVGAYISAIENIHTPTILCLSRQGVPTLLNSNAEKVALGGYIIGEYGNGTIGTSGSLIIVATGTEVSLAIKTAINAINENIATFIRIVSMPCCELFDKQSFSKILIGDSTKKATRNTSRNKK